jgi:hypothetical protein
MTVSRYDQGNTGSDPDRRAVRRRDERCAAVVSTHTGCVTGRVADLSRTGACIEGNSALADLLLAAGRRAGDGTASYLVHVRFDLPAGAGSMPVAVQARSVYVMHLHDDTYRCGLEFRLFVEGEAAFTAFLQTGEAAE